LTTKDAKHAKENAAKVISMTWETTIWFLLGTILPSFVLAWGLTFAARYLAPRWGLVDRPNQRKVHAHPTPLGGGLAIGLGVIGTFLAGQAVLVLVVACDAQEWLPAFARPHVQGILQQSVSLWTILLGGAALMVIGLLDDRFGVDWRIRLGLQFFVAAFCVITQGWRLTAFIEIAYLASAISIVLSTLWIVALVNSFNMLDNMDGLSAGVAFIASCLLAAVLLIAPDPVTDQPQLFVAGFLLVLAGALLGFLIHNRPPAKIFMGDAGSYFVGFCIAVATLLATYASYHDKRHAILAPLCVMAVPLYDMSTVIWIRIREGRSPFEADKNHFSHRLVELGFSKGQAVLTIYLTTATCGLGALLLHQVNLFGAGIILLLVLSVLCLIAVLESTARRKLNE
jgi:UDP-GlcNAc:undecaprenyl-phosphate GlcNAc-1-phosphate transferase